MLRCCHEHQTEPLLVLRLLHSSPTNRILCGWAGSAHRARTAHQLAGRLRAVAKYFFALANSYTCTLACRAADAARDRGGAASAAAAAVSSLSATAAAVTFAAAAPASAAADLPGRPAAATLAARLSSSESAAAAPASVAIALS